MQVTSTKKYIIRIILFFVTLVALAKPAFSSENKHETSGPVIAGVIINSCVGSITISVTSGLAPYTYEWKDSGGNVLAATGFVITGLGPDNYEVTVTDANGDTVNAIYTVTNPPDLVGTVVVNNVTCRGDSDAQVIVTMGNGNPGYDWELYNSGGGQVQTGGISFPNNVITIGGLGVDSYSLEVTDQDGCTGTINFNVTEPANFLGASLVSQTNATCSDATNGSLEVTGTGGWGSYTYSWFNSGGNYLSSGATISGLSPGDYTVVITDLEGCSVNPTYTITGPAPITATATQVNASCNGNSDGSIDVTVGGGNGGFTYSWNTGATTQDLSGLSAGNYTLTITDVQGCTLIENYTITEPAVLAINETITDVDCKNNATGAIQSNVSGGTAPYTYSWSTGATSADISGLTAGSYSLTVTDANGCITNENFTVSEPALVLSIDGFTETLPTCFGGADGTLQVNVSGGTAPYSYSWSTGGTSASINGLSSGIYAVTVTDANGCIVVSNHVLADPPAISISSSVTIPSCNGGTDGSITASASNGTAPYTYNWNTGDVGATITNIAAGNYQVTVIDANGCSQIENIVVGEPAAIQSNAVVSNISCNGLTDGSISLAVTGGTAPYTYSWSTGATGTSISSLSAGNYSVTITDANGCIEVDNFTVIEPGVIGTSFTKVDVLCKGNLTGSIDLTVTGGTAPYSFAWSNGANTEDVSGLAAGSYSVTVTDASGCNTVENVTITEPATALVLSGVETDISCEGGSDGSIDLTVSGGAAPYTYSWNTGATSEDLINVAAGSYSVQVTDANGCVQVLGFTLTQPAPFLVTPTITNISCNGADDGSISLNVSGGTAPYTYSWSDGPTTQNRSNLTPGGYTITVTDANGCQNVQALTITEPDALGISFTKQDVLCHGESTGSIDITVTGGTAPYTYSWSNGALTEDLSSLVAGNYSVTVTDANGCMIGTSVDIFEPAAALSFTSVVQQITCNGAADGVINLTVSGGTAPYTYSWSNGSTSEDLSNLPAATYTVTITDANGCNIPGVFVITEPAALVSNGTESNVSCFGAADGSIDLEITGGEAPYTYVWAHGPNTEDVNGLTPGSYSVQVTDNRGCVILDSFTITEPSALSLSSSKTDVSCFGGSDGAIDATVTGGTAPYSFNWSNGAASEDVSGLSAGIYTLTVTDANGCQAIENVTIDGPAAALAESATTTDITCNGANNGVIDLTVSGGTAPYTYSWNDGLTTQDRSALSPGTFTVTITDANGCQVIEAYTIVEPAVLVVAPVKSDISCFGADDGAIDLTVSGGTTPYTYLWNDGGNTQDRSSLSPGNYSVLVTDANGCQDFQNFVIAEPAQLSLSYGSTDVDCFGNSNGSIDLTVSGGTAPYTYSWSNGSLAQDLNSLLAGTYTVTVTDANGCMANETVTISEPSALALSDSFSDVSCNGFNDGSIDLTVSGGTAPYTYAWGDGATSEDRLGLVAGNYDVTITDANGCSINRAYTITEPSALAVVTSSQNLSCFGADDGTIDLTVSGGTAPYSFSWTDGATSEDRANLAQGNYSVTITDANGCQEIENFTITTPTALAISVASTDVDCFGNSTGAIDITITGGTAPYSYSWSSGETIEDLSNLTAGDYTVTATDANGCQIIETVTINEPSQPLTVVETVSDITCFGANDGSVQLAVSGGTAPYTYSWDNGASSQNLTGLIVGNYSVTVTDANGCSVSETYRIESPTALQLSGVVTDLACNNDGTGAIDLTVSGGTTPYTFSWTDGSVSEDLAGKAAGTYQVTVTDANGCIISRSFTITEPLALQASATVTDVVCFGQSDGNIQVDVSGGVGPYSYLWSNGAVTEDLFNISGGTYSLTITDVNGCQLIQNYVVDEPATALTVTGTSVDVSCFGAADGSVDIQVTGGTAPYSYSWNQGAITEDIAGLGPGGYQVTVTDANGCTVTEVFTVQGPDLLQATANVMDVSCNGGGDGSIDISVLGGTAPFTFSWADGPTTEDRSGLIAGTYQLTITDANGCSFNETYTIQEPAALTILHAKTDVSCFSGSDGSIDLTITGGTFPYSYSWSNGSTDADLSDLTAGDYTVTVTDINGCSENLTVTISEPPVLTMSGTATDVTCFGADNGIIDVTISGGTAPYSYNWNDGSTAQDRSDLSPGNYNVVITDALGCQVSESFLISEPDALLVSNIQQNISCFGADDGSVDLSVSGGTAPYQFTWNDGETSEDRSGLSPGSYTVLIEDANGCQQSSTFTIQEPDVLSISTSHQDVGCYGELTGTINSTVVGGTAPYSFSWSNGATTEDLSGLAAGTYSVEVTDANGCQAFETITIQQPLAPLTVSAIQEDESCFGSADGQIDLTISGGTAPYAYTWNTGASSEDISGLGPGNYQVTVTDNNGCSVQVDYIISGPQPITLVGAVTPISCFENNDGAIDMTVSGGTAPYSFAWGNGERTEDLTGLAPGSYSVVVTDANGCVESGTYVVSQPLPLVANYAKIDVSCFGTEDGSIDLAVSGGTGPYQYSWSNGATTEDLNALSGGSYTVTITDSRGCQIMETIQIQAPATPLMALETVGDATCFGLPNGTISLSVSGGTAPYSYSWSNGSNQRDLTNVFAGTYEVTITDSRGCTFIRSYQVGEPEPIDADFEIENTSCFGDRDGSIRLTPRGGNAPYSFIWSNGSTSKDQFGLGGGTYNVTITDANNCSITKAVEVADSRQLTVSVDRSDVLCKGATTGAINLVVSGGSGNYTFAWSNGETSQNLNDLVAGVYDVTVTDAGGCATATTVVISEPAQELSLDVDHTTELLCFGDNSGFARADPQGGVAPYTYLWSNGARTRELTDLTAGAYTLSVTDANGCLVQQNFEIIQPSSPLTIEATGNLDLACSGLNDGFIEIDVQGGTAPYVVRWSNGSEENRIENLVAGDYVVRVQDAVGCIREEVFTVAEPEELRIANAAVNQSQCFDDRNGSIELDVVGGTLPYTYQWSNGITTKNLVGIPAGDYELIVTDARGCVVTGNYTLEEPALFLMDPIQTNISCVGANDGSISLNIQGGVGQKAIRWNTGASSETITGLEPGAYNVIVTDENGCSIQQNFQIIEPGPLVLDAFVRDALECGNPKSGQINLIVSGGTEPFTYRWSNGDTSQVLSGVLPGTYNVKVTDVNGCTIDGTYSVQQPPPLQVGISSDILIDCDTRRVTALISVSPKGGFGAYSIDWSTGLRGTQQLIVDQPGRVAVDVMDGRGCMQTRAIDVVFPDLGEADFEYRSDAIDRTGELAANDPVSFFDQSLGDVVDWSWDFGDGFESSEIDPIHTFDAPGTYVVRLEVLDASGCSSIREQTLIITEGYRVLTPNAFTPNNDGNNDFFRPKMLGLAEAEFHIFNTWGEVIFSTDDLNSKGWDGMIKGIPAENGNYVYKLIGKSFNGLEVQREGIFALIR